MAIEAMCYPEDKESLADDICLWMRKWEGILVRVFRSPIDLS